MLVVKKPANGYRYGQMMHPGRMAQRHMSQPNYRPAYNWSSLTPKVDVIEDNERFYLEIELPGLKRDDFKVSVDEDRTLIIKGERKYERDEEKDTVWKKERAYGEFERKFQLPDNVEDDKIDAMYENGLLTLTLHKKKPSVKDIAIES